MSRRLRLFPLNAVLFPGSVLNLHIFEARYKQMIDECLESGESFGVALIAQGAEAGDPNVTPHDVGSVAEILDVQPLPMGRYYISTVGRERFKITQIVSRDPYLVVEAEPFEESDAAVDDAEVARLSARVRSLFTEYVEIVVELSGGTPAIALPQDAKRTSFLVGDVLQVGESVKQRLLELDTTKQRLAIEFEFLEKFLPQLRRLLERHRASIAQRHGRGEDPAYRPGQEKYFGRYFSPN